MLFDQGEQFQVTAGDATLRFILLSAPRIDEPIAWGGPIVMNTQDELDQAFRKLEEGAFIKQ